MKRSVRLLVFYDVAPAFALSYGGRAGSPSSGGKMFTKDRSKISFFGVGILLILSGAVVFSVGMVMWLFNFFGTTDFSVPSQKIIGGLVVLALGYIVIDLDLLRAK